MAVHTHTHTHRFVVAYMYAVNYKEWQPQLIDDWADGCGVALQGGSEFKALPDVCQEPGPPTLTFRAALS